MRFYWYSSIWYLDMPMHFLGGFWLGLAAIYLFLFGNQSFKSILGIFLIILIVGVGWEMFEILVDKFITYDLSNSLDTVSDILFDLAGGLSAVFYFFKQTISIKENTL